MRAASSIEVHGYASEQIDFTIVHAELSEQAKQFIDDMIEAAVAAESDPGGSRFSYITIEGHSDRVDTAGLTPEARRAKELEASELRAEAAQAFFFDQIAQRLLDGGFIVPADLASAQNFFINAVACGASRLKHLVPSGEAQRRENRRVEILAVDFSPGNP
jgi:flagellar motor protein MotB